MVGYLLVCGRGLASLLLLPLDGLRRRFGVLRLVRLSCRWRRLVVFSMNQCVQFFQWAMMAWLGFFFVFCCPFASWGCAFEALLSLFLTMVSDVVTRCSVDPRDLALRMTPSFGGGIGRRWREVETERIESLSIGVGGTSSRRDPPLSRLASGSWGKSEKAKSPW